MTAKVSRDYCEKRYKDLALFGPGFLLFKGRGWGSGPSLKSQEFPVRKWEANSKNNYK